MDDEHAPDWDCTPNWRDNPDDLNKLCDLGAQLLHHRQPHERHTTTVSLKGDYL